VVAEFVGGQFWVGFVPAFASQGDSIQEAMNHKTSMKYEILDGV
jgi:hypothetical protein